jgi:hypothetical protein
MSFEGAATARPTRRRAALVLALLFASCAALLAGPSLAPAARAKSSCSRAKHARACAGRRHAHGKPKRHSKHRSSSAKGPRQGAAGSSSAPAPKPATCEDGSRPFAEADGSFSCADGSEPDCPGGARPVAAKGSGKAVCPSPVGAWSEAGCEDGSAPERSGGSIFACEDGSAPLCADGSKPTTSEDGSMLVCIARGSADPSSPSAGEEEDKEEVEG